MAWVKERVTGDGDKRFVACYRDPEGRQRSAGTYSSRRAAERAGNREDAKVREGAWHDHSRGEVTFAEYVETVWLPSKQVETSTLAAYRSYLDKHFIPTFGRRPMGKILPSEIQRWVTTATDNGLSAASVGKYHTMLQSVFERALVDRVVTFNPCAHTELPKRVKKKSRTLTPEEYDAILNALPAQHRLMVETAINTGLRWGELIALKPRHVDLAAGTLTVEETIVEVVVIDPTAASGATSAAPANGKAEVARGMVEGLLKHMGVRAQVTVRAGSEPITLDISGRDLGALIGWRGETLRALQSVTNVMVGRQLAEGERIIVDVERYRQRREHTVREIAMRAARQVKMTGDAITLDAMQPFERRAIHLALEGDPDVTSGSIGEEPERRVVVGPRKPAAQ